MYLSLSEKDYFKFDPVSSITNVFFDDHRQQIFIVKSASISVKSLTCNDSFNFQFDNSINNIIAVKFSSCNNILAIQRNENSLELVSFKNNQIQLNTSIYYETKKTIILGFIWTENNELIVITSDLVEILQINPLKKSFKSVKSLSGTSNWFCSNRTNLLLLSSNNGLVLTPILFNKAGNLAKLASIQMEDGCVTERDVTTGLIYGTPAILVLRTTRNRTLEVFVYLQEGPKFKKSHILKLGFSGRVATSIIDSLIIVHHQTSKGE